MADEKIENNNNYDIETMFTATIYTLSVISLSGIMDETYAVKETVRRWDADNAQRTGRLFLLVDVLIPELSSVLW